MIRKAGVVLLLVVMGLLTTVGESLSFAELSDIAGPFEGVDRKGHAFYLLKLGQMGKIPVYAYWSSAEKTPSPLLGAGWDIPLLSSRIYLVSSGCLKLHLPDGYVRHFHRGKDGVFRGGHFWTAQVDGDTIRVIADSNDGYPRTVLVFFKGRLQRLECEEGVFDFQSDARAGWTVLSRGAKVLTATQDASDANRIQIRIGSVRWTGVKAEQASCGRQSSLISLVSSTGEQHAFAYGGDALHAWLSIDNQQLAWDPTTRLARSWKDFSFIIGASPSDEVSGPKITRMDSSGRRESYVRDVRKGLLTEEGPDDVKIVTRFFTSGDNAGKVRWRERYVCGTCVERVDYIYDRTGRVVDRLIRTSRN